MNNCQSSLLVPYGKGEVTGSSLGPCTRALGLLPLSLRTKARSSCIACWTAEAAGLQKLLKGADTATGVLCALVAMLLLQVGLKTSIFAVYDSRSNSRQNAERNGEQGSVSGAQGDWCPWPS